MFNFKWFYTLLFLMPVLLLVSPAMAQTGEELYNVSCAGCHNNGVLGAPGIGTDQTMRWSTSLSTHGGIEGFYQYVQDPPGPPGMGSCFTYLSGTDDEQKMRCEMAIDYMLEASGVSLSPPPPPIRLELRLFLEGTLK